MVDSFVVSPVGDAPAIRVGDVVSKSWRLFISRWGPFIGLALVAFAPQLLFALLVPKMTSLAFVGSILQVACTSLADAAIIYGVVQVLRGRDFTFAESLKFGFGRMGPIVGLSLVVGILAVLGAILLVVPGIIVGVMYAVAVPVCVAERLGVGGSMTRSAFLTKGNRWRIFGVLVLVGVVTVVLYLVVAVAAGFLIGLSGLTNLTGLTLIDVALYPIEAAAGAFNAVVAGVLYYQLRVVKEGVDIDKIAAVFD